ncbi:MAG: hypothetical protein WKG07_23595 [Hymenobacter sp.]
MPVLTRATRLARPPRRQPPVRKQRRPPAPAGAGVGCGSQHVQQAQLGPGADGQRRGVRHQRRRSGRKIKRTENGA